MNERLSHRRRHRAGLPSVAILALVLALAGCAKAPAGSGAANSASPAIIAASVAAPTEDFCAPFSAMAEQTCKARYACSEPALEELSAAACGCRNGTLPQPTERERLALLLRETRSFACCAGIAIARNGTGCGALSGPDAPAGAGA